MFKKIENEFQNANKMDKSIAKLIKKENMQINTTGRQKGAQPQIGKR